jgi:predicted RNA polymerase sigma factor
VHWPREGVPDKPDAWLIRTASRRLIDRWRSDRSRRDREALAAQLDSGSTLTIDRDDSLLVLFLCCHPTLTPASAVALTLRAVGGLTTAEIARAYLVPEPTMAQRISRAKERIRESGVSLPAPGSEQLAARIPAVLNVLYLIFNEGYAASGGPELQRPELVTEAIRLARMLRELRPNDAEVLGLLALMLLIDARRAARTDAGGELVPLPEQDRTLWDRAQIQEGAELLEAAMRCGRVGSYQLQAAIAAIHDRADDASATDWPQIAALYGLLERITDNPVVSLNRAVAVAMADGPQSALAIVDSVSDRLAGHYRLDAVRAHLLELSGRDREAVRHYRAAAARTTNLPERRYLLSQAGRLARSSESNAAGA